MTDMQITQGWHLDKRVPLALIITLILQTLGGVVWLTRLGVDVDNLKVQQEKNSSIPERLIRLEVKQEQVLTILGDIKKRIDK